MKRKKGAPGDGSPLLSQLMSSTSISGGSESLGGLQRVLHHPSDADSDSDHSFTSTGRHNLEQSSFGRSEHDNSFGRSSARAGGVACCGQSSCGACTPAVRPRDVGDSLESSSDTWGSRRAWSVHWRVDGVGEGMGSGDYPLSKSGSGGSSSSNTTICTSMLSSANSIPSEPSPSSRAVAGGTPVPRAMEHALLQPMPPRPRPRPQPRPQPRPPPVMPGELRRTGMPSIVLAGGSPRASRMAALGALSATGLRGAPRDDSMADSTNETAQKDVPAHRTDTGHG
jgi:hypothetical protein